jgi:signal transduction histidine kinase
MTSRHPGLFLSPWELAAETIAVKIRWFGLVVGYLLVNTSEAGSPNRFILNAILAVGILYAVADTLFSFRGRVFLHRHPLLISLMEALFIGLLCSYDNGLDSPFRYYYFLSLICCAVRHPAPVTYATCALHCASCILLFIASPLEDRDLRTLLLTLVMLGWVTWAADALALLLKRVGNHLSQLNDALRGHQAELEGRIAERTLQLQESQALVLHQEKMAAFGLLAAGIAHEVGNPLTSVSSLVQILQRRHHDSYTEEKLGLINGQLRRIQNTLRELINFSRPANRDWALVSLSEIINEALHVAKYYKRTKQRQIATDLATDLPPVLGKRDLLLQVVLNLVLNASDATERGGRIVLRTRLEQGQVCLTIEDDGSGISPEDSVHLFQPYFTTKPEGTGLGLFVTRKLVSEHGGAIDFTSTPGMGTTFHVRLPAATVHQPLATSAAMSLERVHTVPQGQQEKN